MVLYSPQTAANSNSQTGGTSFRPETSKPSSSKTMFDSSGSNQVGRPISNPGRGSDYAAVEVKHRVEDDVKAGTSSL
ncbi:hypothetical protein KIW84_022296 [Lathyrus oleraceus]|uniref:Uncharacterized protein n=1 Tax=Pisum sativum TaxID=3888 RepID=A0A9D4YCT0_PEA|nr:hypothetical protein KIW84_045037 [Pisum sativum]KAI5423914.1 hypothetical protein KIW84_030219 [Pisum sativum]KAI5435813.1 hypothetical protein KIW84_022296 [Pisum sativum]